MVICISYQHVKNLYASWTNAELTGDTCAPELAENYPATAIMDNDDFKEDTLTGADNSNRTNLMFVQPSNIHTSKVAQKGLLLVLPEGIKHLVDDQNKSTPYKTVLKGVPAVRERSSINVRSTDAIRTEQIIHTIVRMDDKLNNIEQSIGSFAGYQSLFQFPVTPSKPHYFRTLPKPPRKSVVNEVMMRLIGVIAEKNISFVQLVGDQPVYTLIVQLINENFDKFKNIILVLGPFHTQSPFITVINKRFSGSGITELIVSTDIIADKSVYQAFSGKHYRRIFRALQLFYEALQRNIIRTESGDALELLDKVRNTSEFIIS